MAEKEVAPGSNSLENLRWPEGAQVYHIYPRSFYDSNGDGIGDLKGITEKLPYLKGWKDAIWLSPFYKSPMADFGYDVADYCDVDPVFGNLEDFKELTAEAERNGINMIIDLVPNHTSSAHEWFKQSRQSPDNPYSEWYIWRDPRPGPSGEPMPPNNWLDALGGQSAWEWEPARQQYYLHSFHKDQPDLNWSNPEVRDAIKDVMRFWLDIGVKGYRVDAVLWMAKDPLLGDDSANPDYVEGVDPPYESLLHDNSRGWPALYAYLSEMAEVLTEEKYREQQPFMITEAYPERHNPVVAYLNFYVGMNPVVAAPFNFEGISLPWEANAWRRFLKSFHAALDQLSSHCVASYAFGNHDQKRTVSRLGEAAARSAALMQHTLPGMIFVYYGEELGMKDVEIPLNRVQDPAAKGDPVHGQGRDPARTPMQWTADKHAGFTTAKESWLPVSPDYKTINVEQEMADPGSFITLYKKLGELRMKSRALKTGHIALHDASHEHVLSYSRTNNDEHYVVLINFSDRPAACISPVQLGRLVVSSDAQTTLISKPGEAIALRPHEAVLYEATTHRSDR
jgi:alpha-glucosidase